MNPHKGEAGLVDGETVWTLRFSTNALCELEAALGESVNAIAQRLGDPARVNLTMIRALLWAGLRDRHAGTSLPRAGEIVDAVGMAAAMAAIARAFALAFPEAEAADQSGLSPGEGDAARP